MIQAYNKFQYNSHNSVQVYFNCNAHLNLKFASSILQVGIGMLYTAKSHKI